MESQTIGTQHGAAARKRANRIVLIAKEQTWTGLDFLSTQVLTAGHYVLGFARGLITSPRARPRRRGFNVMPTARNARGIDILGYDDQGKAFSVQVKTITKRTTIPLGTSGSHLMADYLVVVVLEGKWSEDYIWTREEMRKAKISTYMTKGGKKGKGLFAFWIHVSAGVSRVYR